MKNIHPTAVIGDNVKLGQNVKIGPYCVIDGEVTLGDNVELKSHVVINGKTSIGEGTVIFPFASIGYDPQILNPERCDKSELIIGKFNTIREHVTINHGSEKGTMKTVIGDHCFFMISSHVAHDCIVGNHVVMANNATLGGHVVVGDYVTIGGLVGVHQFVHIGRYAMIGGMSGVDRDVIPFSLVKGERAFLVGLNLVGLNRQGFDKKTIFDLKNSYQMIFAPEGTMQEKIENVSNYYKEEALVQEIVSFIKGKKRGICLPASE